MLRDSFFEIISSYEVEGGDAVRVRLFPEHEIFKAHFPGYPITPGVCVAQMAVEVMSYLRRQKLALRGVKDMKFLKPVLPSEVTELLFTVKGDSVVVSEDDVIFAKMTFVF